MAATGLAVQGNTRIVNYTDAITNVGDSIEARARYNVEVQLADMAANGDTREFSALELQAMEQVESLKLVSGLDLYAILLRFKFLENIRINNLLNVHPGRYTDYEHPLTRMADEQGISASELHDTIKMGSIIFPFLVRQYGENAVADMWAELGKSKIRALVATLSAAITGTNSGSQNVRATLAVAEEAAALQHATESTLTWQEVEPAERRERTAREIVEIARRSPTVRHMRAELGGTRTQNITFFAHAEDDGRTVVIAELNPDQRTMLGRLSERIEFQRVGQEDGGFDSVESTFLNVNALIDRARVRMAEPVENND